MPKFGQASRTRLDSCDKRLQDLFNEVINHADCTVTAGHRGQQEQEEAYRTGRSKVRWPNSKHNSVPSLAADVVPYPIEWPNPNMGREEYARSLGRWYMFVGLVRGIAAKQGIKVRCGADWDGDFDVKDQNFHDLPHFEIVD